MKSNIEELCKKKYINNPPEGMTSMGHSQHESEDDLLDMDYFLN